MQRFLGIRSFRTRHTVLFQLVQCGLRRRLYAANPKPSTQQKTRSRIERVTRRLPIFLQRICTPLVTAPLSHVSAFLILHEITAIVPLIGLAATFHYTNWLPPYISEGRWINEHVKKFGDYFRKKGWLGQDSTRTYRWWGKGEMGTRVIVE